MSFLITSVHLSFGLPKFRRPPTSIFHVLVTTSSSVFLSKWPNHLSLLLFSHLSLPHLPLLLFLHSSSSQSSLFPSSNSTFSSYFFIPDLLNPLYSHHPTQHSHLISSFLIFSILFIPIIQLNILILFLHSWSSQSSLFPSSNSTFSSYFFIPDLLNPLYSHHPTQHSHLISSFLIFSILFIPIIHLNILILFLHSWSSQSSLFPSSNSTFSSYFFIPDLLNPLYSHHPTQHSHLISSFLIFSILFVPIIQLNILILFLLSWSSQSSLFPSSNSTFSSYFFCPDLLNPLCSHHPTQHSHLISSVLIFSILFVPIIQLNILILFLLSWSSQSSLFPSSNSTFSSYFFCPDLLNPLCSHHPTQHSHLISSVLIFSILFIAIIHLNILNSVLSNKFCLAFLSAQISLPYTRNRSDDTEPYVIAGLMIVLKTLNRQLYL